MEKKYKNIHQELINNCKKGDTQSQFEIYKHYYKAMYNTCFRLINNSMEAEDIMQEAFLKAFKKINTYKEEVSFGAWLKRIVINSSLDALKKRKLDEEPLEYHQLKITDDAPCKYDSDSEYEEKIIEINKAISELPDNQRVLINLHLIEGYDHDEISMILNMSNAAVRTAYSRAKKRLQETLTTKRVLYG